MRHRRASALLRLLRWIISLALLAGGAVFAWPYLFNLLRPQVTVTTMVEGPVIQAFYATGTLLPVHEYPIKANNPGIITQVLVDKGDSIKREQTLAIVAEDGIQFKYDQAKAEHDQRVKLADEKSSPVLAEFDARIQASQEILEIVRREQKRVSDMLEHTAATQADLDTALNRVKSIWAELEGLKAQRNTKKLELQKDLEVAGAALKNAAWNLDRQTIRSPIDGVVLDRPLTVGTRVGVNDHIMQTADVRPRSLVMRAAVDEEDKTQVRVGQVVRMTLYAFADRAFEGRVKKVYDKADAERRTFEVDVAMADDNLDFAAGMTGELAFIIEHKDMASIVPSQAVQGGHVYVVRDGQLTKLSAAAPSASADIKLGLRSVERTEILSGLSVNDHIVISPAVDLSPGQRVRTTFTDPVTAAALNRPKPTEAFKGFN